MVKKFLVSLICVLVTLFLLFIVDASVGLFKGKKEGILPFPVSTTLRYKTSEFDYIASINSLGFRDREFGLSKLAQHRVLAFGDSFTYGWGVEIEQTWTKVLEKNLKNSGLDVEIANLGVPGGSPVVYAEFAEKAVPLLKPDLVVVGILQGDDIAQMRDDRSKRISIKSIIRFTVNTLKTGVRKLYPNFLSLVKPRPHNKTLNEMWKESANSMYLAFKKEEKKRFEGLDPQIKESFLNGDLNPSLINISVKYPSYYLDNLDLNKPKVQEFIGKMAEKLRYIKKVADKNQSQLLVVSVPHPAFTGREDLKNIQKLGYMVDEKMLTTDTMDEALKRACQKAQVGFYAVTPAFRAKSGQLSEFFFARDGHFNPKGHKLFAELLAPPLTQVLKDKTSSGK